MSAPATAVMLAAYALFVAACVIAACICAERARASDLPGPGPVGAGLVSGALTSRAGEQFLAAPVACDETTLDLETWKQRDPIRAYAWLYRQGRAQRLAAQSAGVALDAALHARSLARDADIRARAAEPIPHLDRPWEDGTDTFRAICFGGMS